MKRIRNKMMSWLLTVAMLGSMLPLAALPAAAASELWSDNAYIETMPVNQDITITTAAQLAGFAKNVNAGNTYHGYKVTLGADIDLSAHYWIPIGTGGSNYFDGIFLGNGYSITGMTIETSSDHYVGLFGLIEDGGQISNVYVSGSIVVNSTESGADYVGGLIGRSNNDSSDNMWSQNINNCRSDVSITYNNNKTGSECLYIGGLIGYASALPKLNKHTYYQNSSSHGDISFHNLVPSSVTLYAGGLIGFSDMIGSPSHSAGVPTLKTCYATGNVTATGETLGSMYLGGLEGCTETVWFCSSYATGSVSSSINASTVQMGGLIGRSSPCSDGTSIGSGELYNSYSTGDVSYTGAHSAPEVGGFIGHNAGGLDNCFSIGKVTAPDATYCNGFVGKNGSHITNCYWLQQEHYNEKTMGSEGGTVYSLTMLTPEQFKNQGSIGHNDTTYSTTGSGSQYETYDLIEALSRGAGLEYHRYVEFGMVSGTDCPVHGLDTWTQPGNFDSGIANAPPSNLTIHTAKELAGLAYATTKSDVDYTGYTVTLANNIDLSGHYWTPIGMSKYFSGVFDGKGYTISGMDCLVGYTNYQAGLFGYINGATLKNMNVSGIIHGAMSRYGMIRGGGLVGQAMQNTTIRNCSSSVTISTQDYSCGSTGSNTRNMILGGLVGVLYKSNTIENCSATGDITADCAGLFTEGTKVRIGGLVGDASYMAQQIRSSCASGDVSVGGNYTEANAGGLSGTLRGTATNCFSEGAVTGTSLKATEANIGGFIGNAIDDCEINNSYGVGAVNIDGNGISALNAGGFVGTQKNDKTGTYYNCYTASPLTVSGTVSTKRLGGFVGYQPSSTTSIKDCYWLKNGVFVDKTKGCGTNSGTITSLTMLLDAQLYGTLNIGSAATVGTSDYAESYILQALNTENDNIADAVGWLATPSTNNGYPIFGFGVKYDGNGAEGGSVPVDNSAYMSGQTAIVKSNEGNLIKSGVNFMGWNTALDGSGKTYVPGSSLVIGVGNTTLYAVWKDGYSVTFFENYSGGGTTIVFADNGATISAPEVPTRVGYTFGGWYKEPECSNAWNFDTDTVSATTTLYAKWTACPYTVTYDANGEAGDVPVDATEYYYESNVTVLGNIGATPLAKAGHTFTGWNTEANGTGTAYAPGATLTMPAENVTVYAQWSVNSNTLRYNANGAAGDLPADSESVDYGTTVTVLGNVGSTALSLQGHTFAGWNTASDGSGISYTADATFAMPDEAVTLYAIWTTNMYTVSYNGNGNTDGSAPATLGHPYGTEVTVSEKGTLAKTGYNFLGWSKTQDSTTAEYVAGTSKLTMPDGNVTLYAIWEKHTYNVSYNGNGATAGTVPSTSLIPTLFGDSVTVLGNDGVLEKTGYTFIGWNTKSDGSGTSYAKDNTFLMPANDVVLYAQWAVNSYNLSYDGNGKTGGTLPATVTYDYNETATVSGNTGLLTRTGYTFLGWSKTQDAATAEYTGSETFSMPDDNVTLYAVWKVNNYGLSYDANGKTTTSMPTGDPDVDFGDTVTVGAAAVADGFTFIEWNTAADGSGTTYAPNATFSMPANAVTIYAIWDANDYTVTYDGNGNTSGTTPADGTYAYGNEATVAGQGSLLRTGYRFLGWHTNQTATTAQYVEGATFTLGSSDVTLYAVWEKNSYSLSYSGNGNTSGELVTKTASTTPYATSITVDGNTAATPLARTGYTFTGWNTAEDGTGTSYSPGATFTMPANDVVLYAQWSINSYTVSYDGNGSTGGTVPVSLTFDYDETVTASSNAGNLTRDGYTFLGWNTNQTATTVEYAAGTATFAMPDHNVTLYAVWEKNSYNLTYDNNGATSGNLVYPTPIVTEYGATVTVIGNDGTPKLEKTGFTFGGWNTTANATGTNYKAGDTFSMPSGDVTLYAKWMTQRYNVVYSGNGSTGGTTPDTVGYAFEEEVTVSGNTGTLVRTGYTFLGWSESSTATTATYTGTGSETFTMPSNEVTLYAVWSAGSVSLTANALSNGTYDVAYNQSIDAATGGSGNFSYAVTTGTLPAGLNLNASTGAITGTPTAVGTSNFTITATDTGNSQTASANYSITIDKADQTITGTTTYNKSFGDNAFGLGMTAGTTVTYAIATGGEYISLSDGIVTIKAVGTATITASAAGNENYNAADSVTITITISASGTVAAPTASVTDGTAVDKNDTVSLSCSTSGATIYYTTDGSNPTASSTQYTAAIPVTADVTIKAIAVKSGLTSSSVSSFTYTVKTYTVTYNGNGSTSGAVPSEQTLRKGDTMTVSDNAGSLAKDGATFTGWNTTETGSGGVGYSVGSTLTMGTENVTLYAQWSTGAYKITYNGNGNTGGTAPLPGSYNYNTTATISDQGSLVKTGYTFGGWSLTSDGAKEYDAAQAISMPDHDIILYAIWTANAVSLTANALPNGTYDVAYSRSIDEATGGSGSFSYAVTSGDLPAGLSLTAATGAITGTPTAVGTSNFTITVTDTVNSETASADYSIIIDKADQTITGTKTYNKTFGDPAFDLDMTAGTAVTYVISNGDCITLADGKVTITGDGTATITASAGANENYNAADDVTITITIVASGTVAAPTASVNSGEGIDKNDTVTLSCSTADATIYYTTDGSEPTESSAEYTAAITITEAVTIKAIAVKNGLTDSSVSSFAYTLKTYTVSYDGNGNTDGTVPSSKTLSKGDSVKVSDNTGTLVRDGYSFAGWNTASAGNGTAYKADDDLTMDTENVTLYAQWVSADAGLSNLTASAGSFDQAFATATLDYTLTLNASVTNTTVTPTIATAGSTVEVSTDNSTWTSVTSETATDPFDLAIGVQKVYVKVTALDGSTTITYTITIVVTPSAPTITSQPSAITEKVGGTQSLSVSATGTGTLSYQWYRNTSNTNTGGTAVTDGSGGTTNSYTPPSASEGAVYYYCVVTNTVSGASKSIASNAVAVKVESSSSSGGGGSSGAGSHSSSSSNNVDKSKTNLEIKLKTPDGKTENITAEKKTTTENGKTEAQVSLTKEATMKQLKEFAEKNPKYTLQIRLGKVDNFSSKFTVQSVKDLGNNEITIDLGSDSISYVIPAAAINTDKLLGRLGKDVKPSDVEISFSVAESSSNETNLVKTAAQSKGYDLVMQPVNFEIIAKYKGQTIKVDRLENYVTRYIKLAEGVNPERVSTAVVVEADGSFRHVPTQIVRIGSSYYAKISSLSNSTYALIYNECKFSDTVNHWAKESINDLSARTVVNGVGDNRFEPQRYITRAEYTVMMVRALGCKLSEGQGTFKDVSADAWYSSYVETAYECGIARGLGDGTFGPNSAITREQAMAMVYRAAKIAKLDMKLTDGEAVPFLRKFEDSKEVADNFTNEVARCIKSELVKGRDSTHIVPKGDITRAEMISLISRLLKKSDLI